MSFSLLETEIEELIKKEVKISCGSIVGSAIINKIN